MKNKQKTYKAAKKRIKITAKGKLRHKSQNNNGHLRVHKSAKKKARNKGATFLNSIKQIKKIKSLIK